MIYPDSNDVIDYRALLTLSGRGYIVLGAGNGIGRQTCHALAQAGARVLCVDRDPALAESVALEVRGEAATADVTERAEMQGIIDRARGCFGSGLGGLIDIVGMAIPGSLARMEDDDWHKQFNLVLRHAYLALQVGGQALAERGGGSMVFVGSLSGVVSVKRQAAYGSAKAALHHLVRCAAHELGRSNVRVNAVAPSFVRTPRLLKAIPEETWGLIGAANPLGRVAIPAEVASSILFLASDLSSYVTGQVLGLDGGMSVIAALPDF
jgi:NAD(P)-dependent dehydrogenase (short-subunit alcohol dehydrogenase family)